MNLHHTRHFSTGEGQTAPFLLTEKLDDYRTAQLAAAEYRAEGLCCRVEPVEPKSGDPHYRIWTGPERIVQVRTLSHERIRRRKNSRIIAPENGDNSHVA